MVCFLWNTLRYLFLVIENSSLNLSGKASKDGVTNNVATVANDNPKTIAHASGCTKYVSGLL